jgi:curved DNA-binding protein CbpA
MPPDHYAVLGVRPSADAREIRAAYLRVMRTSHPDLRPGDPRAADAARRANEAWRVLRDPAARAAYDRQRRARDPLAWEGQAAGPPAASAYSPLREELRVRFQRASLRVGLVVFALGLVLLAVSSR